MKTPVPSEPVGHVASLHLHPREPGQPLRRVDCIELAADKGIVDEPRYFARITRSTGQPSRRQVSLIEREQIDGHAAALGLETIAPGAVRSNIETVGIDLTPLVGRHIAIGEAILFLYESRTPCAKMDAICAGLRALMENGRQGVMAEVVRSGRILVNDTITVPKTELVA
jgi:hypothetical protein